MDHQDIRTLKILEEIEKSSRLSQRYLAKRLNISLGLVNSFLKRLAKKGFYKVTTVPKNRVKYILTPKGIAEKTRLTYEYIQFSFHFYIDARHKIKQTFEKLEEDGIHDFDPIILSMRDKIDRGFMNSNQQKIDQLIQKGVAIPNPESVEIGEDIKIENISHDRVIIHSGCRLFGKSTLIMGQSQIGYESPVTIQDCQVGPRVTLKGGFFKESVFLEKASAGSGSHVREGCIFEEEANIAHTVGLKQTILFPFVTLGSLINFCDCLMAGGTSRKDHSEVGSAYIHFNFTPNQDKATPSLVGDVPMGVMLDQLPIFLGGQGGLVGPSRLAFGTVIVAGTIFRKDVTKPGKMLFEGAGKGGNVPFVPGLYRGIKRIVVNNSLYIGNLIALLHWYQHVRSLFISDNFPDTLQIAVIEKLQLIIQERIQRFDQLIAKMPLSIHKYKDNYNIDAGAKIMVQQKELFANQSAVNDCLLSMRAYPGDTALRDRFLNRAANASQDNDKNYIKAVQSLDPESKQMGSDWLQGIVDKTLSEVMEVLPSFR